MAANQFSFKISTGASELYLGGMNGNLYQSGSTSWYALSAQNYWLINAGAYLNGTVISSAGLDSFGAIIDTGTSVIVAPTSEAKAFWAAVPNSGSYGSGFYTFDCANPPVVSFAFDESGNEQWAVSPESFNLGTVSSGSSRCVGAVIGADTGVSSWILGDSCAHTSFRVSIQTDGLDCSFLENVYATFDLDQNAVGFSTLA